MSRKDDLQDNLDPRVPGRQPDQIEVLVIAEHQILRDGLARVAQSCGPFNVSHQAATAEEAGRIIAKHHPDAVLVLLTADQETQTRLDHLIPNQAGAPVLALSTLERQHTVTQFVMAGATGCIHANSSPADLNLAIRATAQGYHHFCPKALSQLVNSLRTALTSIQQQTGPLTARETEILTRFAGGEDNAAIAQATGIKTVTVRNTLSRIQNKLRLGSRHQLVIYAIRNGLVNPD